MFFDRKKKWVYLATEILSGFSDALDDEDKEVEVP